MEQSAELVRLEEFVDKLLTKYNQLKSECCSLQETVRQREDECAELKKKVFAMSAERTEVGNKVAGLLGRIEQWESEQLSTTPDSPAESSGAQGVLFGDSSPGKMV